MPEENAVEIIHKKNWRRTHTSGQLWKHTVGMEVTLGGWVHDIRNLGGLAFLHLRDASGIVQVTLERDKDPEMFGEISSLSRESVIMVRGKVVANEQASKGIEIVPEDVKILSKADVPLPLGVTDKVFAELDTRLDNRYLDLRKREVLSLFKIKHEIQDAVMVGLSNLGFIQVNTPKIVATATEGGTELFKVRYFDMDGYLNQSPQLYKQILMGAGFDRVFEVGPAFRAEEHDTVRHLNEFISIDIEMSFADESDAMDELFKVVRFAVASAASRKTEIEAINSGRKMLNKLFGKVNRNISGQNKRINKENQRLKAKGLEIKPLLPLKENLEMLDIAPIGKTIPRIKYEQCIDIASERGIDVGFGEDLSMECMKAVAEVYPGYYFVTHWPTGIKPFYVLPYENNPEVCRAFDLNCGEKEICSGAQRVHRHDLLVERIREQGLDPAAFEFYLAPFRYGMPPHAGWGLGLERLTMVITGVRNVREIVLFPRDRYRMVP